MVDGNQLGQLIDALYASVLESEQWRQAVGMCGHYMGGDDAMLTTVDKKHQGFISTVMAGTMFPVKMADDYANHFIHIDPHHKLLLRGSAIHEWHCSHQVMNQTFVDRNTFYQEFLLPKGVRYLKFATVDDTDATYTTFMCMRTADQQPFGHTEQHAALHFSKHLQRALRLHKHTQALHNNAKLGTIAIDALALSTLIVDNKSTILHLNANAEQLIANPENGLTCKTGYLFPSHPDNHKLPDLIAAATCFRAINGGMILKGKESRQLFVIPLPAQSPLARDWQTPLALVLVVETNRNLGTLTLLGKLYDLSPAELRVAAALLTGKSPEEYAQNAAVSVNTVRTQLRNLFKKTGTSRQSELVALLSRMPALNRIK
jgi:DNA-binding CsgD family transcriptional regulator